MPIVACHRTQEESALAIASLNAERDDLKGLLLAALQRLEAVDELVQRADISSAMMEDKARGGGGRAWGASGRRGAAGWAAGWAQDCAVRQHRKANLTTAA